MVDTSEASAPSISAPVTFSTSTSIGRASRVSNSSLTLPSETMRPRLMRPIRLQIISTSGMMWVEKNTVFPRFFRPRMRSRTSARPMGSRPLIGSSRMTSSGSWSSAWAMPTRWFMPLE